MIQAGSSPISLLRMRIKYARTIIAPPTLHVWGALIGKISMGKLRAKKRRGRGRLQPTGLPSVKETVEQQQLQPATANKIAILDQVRRKNLI